MATIAEIKAELTGVNAATYSGMTDAEAAAALVAINNVEQRESISGSELFGYTDETEYNALTDAKKSQWLGICGIESVTKAAVPIIKDIFPNGTTTWGNIVKTETVYPFAGVNEGDVRKARNS